MKSMTVKLQISKSTTMLHEVYLHNGQDGIVEYWSPYDLLNLWQTNLFIFVNNDIRSCVKYGRGLGLTNVPAMRKSALAKHKSCL